MNFAKSRLMRIKLVQQRWAKPNRLKHSTTSVNVYEIRPRANKHGVDLISDALPFGRLWYGGPNATSDAIGYAQFYSRSHHAVIRVYDEAGNVIEAHERKSESKSGEVAVPNRRHP
jgi:hypothetical protein